MAEFRNFDGTTGRQRVARVFPFRSNSTISSGKSSSGNSATWGVALTTLTERKALSTLTHTEKIAKEVTA